MEKLILLQCNTLTLILSSSDVDGYSPAVEPEYADHFVLDNDVVYRPIEHYDQPIINIYDDEYEDEGLRVLDEDYIYLKPYNKSATLTQRAYVGREI